MTLPLFVVMKKGLYLASQGEFTPILKEAQTYTLEEISELIAHPGTSYSYMLKDEAPTVAPGAAAQDRISYLEEELAKTRRELQKTRAWNQLDSVDQPDTFVYFICFCHEHGFSSATVHLSHPWDETTPDWFSATMGEHGGYNQVCVMNFNLVRSFNALPAGMMIQ